MIMLCARVHIELSRSPHDAVSISRCIYFKKVWRRTRQPYPERVGWNRHLLGARPARPDPEGDLMNSNAFAIAFAVCAAGVLFAWHKQGRATSVRDARSWERASMALAVLACGFACGASVGYCIM